MVRVEAGLQDLSKKVSRFYRRRVLWGSDDVPPVNKTTLYNVILMKEDDTWEQIIENEPNVTGTGNQKKVDEIYTEMKDNEFGDERYAICFNPGTYKLNILLGYYTSVIGMGVQPDEVVINGVVEVENKNHHGALDNFWRSCTNVKIVVPNNGDNKFRVSQAAPFRRNHVVGNLWTSEYEDEDEKGFSSGGFISDCKVEGNINMYTQQQFYTSNTDFKQMYNGDWNIFNVGNDGTYDVNINACTQQTKLVTSIDQNPRTAGAPYLARENGAWVIHVPNVVTDHKGVTDWSDVTTITDFTIVASSNTIEDINKWLQEGITLVFPPGVYSYAQELRVKKDNTNIIGLGYATLRPSAGNAAIVVEDGVVGVRLASLLIDAGTTKSNFLVAIGEHNNSAGSSDNPTMVQDVFMRVGPNYHAEAGTMLVVHQQYTIVQNPWMWRADHSASKGGGLGVNNCKVDHCLHVTGDHVELNAIFAEHALKELILIDSDDVTMNFLQSELLYEASEIPDWDYPALRVSGSGFTGRGLGVYSFFSKVSDPPPTNVPPSSSTPSVTSAIVVATAVASTAVIDSCFSLHLNADDGYGQIASVINGQGQLVDASKADQPSWCNLNGTPNISCQTCSDPIT